MVVPLLIIGGIVAAGFLASQIAAALDQAGQATAYSSKSDTANALIHIGRPDLAARVWEMPLEDSGGSKDNIGKLIDLAPWALAAFVAMPLLKSFGSDK